MVAFLPIPEFLLVCDAASAAEQFGTWRFSLETADGVGLLDVAETEPGDLNRLALLSVVRGLEAIEGQAHVTLISTSRYVIRGLRDSLHRWRENGFMWEHFGRMLPVQNTDLWQRIDRALQFHEVNACLVTATRVSGHGSPPRGDDRRQPASISAESAWDTAAQPPAARETTAREIRRPEHESAANVPPASAHVEAAWSAGAGIRSAAGGRAAPGDRLRRWLMAQGCSGGAAPRRRYGPADLAVA